MVLAYGLSKNLIPSCYFCNEEQNEVTYKRCNRCKAAIYCGQECQTKDWSKHRKFCKDLELMTKAIKSSKEIKEQKDPIQIHELNVAPNFSNPVICIQKGKG